MLIGALGCNLAWGIIDAAFYLINCLTMHGRNATLLRRVQRAATPAQAQQIIADALPSVLADALQAAELDRVHQHLKQLPEPAGRPRLTGENWRGAVGVFLLVFLSTLPVIVPFAFMQDARLALRISNGIAIAMLFAAGSMLATYAGIRRVPTGLAMVAIGSALVALTIALGG
jgi:VIT1/CCC1 family predicted Fe2+/Mn2+ transporter